MKKRCSRCHIVKDSEEFYDRESSTDGKDYYCKDCHYLVKRVGLGMKRRWTAREEEIFRKSLGRVTFKQLGVIMCRKPTELLSRSIVHAK